MRLKGKSALITGSAQGIGKDIALLFAKEGCDIAVSDINLQMAEETAAEIAKSGVNTIAAGGNVAAFDDCRDMVEKAVSHFGKLDILVNNAGITRDGFLMRMKEEDWDMVLDVNLKGTFNCIKAVARHMSKQKSGKVINVASVVGEMGNVGQANYSASKGGVIALTKTAAREFAIRNINVNAVAPGFIVTAMTDKLSDKVKEGLTSQIPLGKLGYPRDVANAVLFLASEESSYITGQVLNINGGMYM
jgi:3-oxoacyl-[acyl-carrier protein] reductase